MLVKVKHNCDTFKKNQRKVLCLVIIIYRMNNVIFYVKLSDHIIGFVSLSTLRDDLILLVIYYLLLTRHDTKYTIF